MNSAKPKGKKAAGKPVSSSSHSLSVHFDATTEKIEETYSSEDEYGQTDPDKFFTGTSTFDETEVIVDTGGDGSSSSSPRLLHLPRLSKRSTSIDTATLATHDSSPPSDPWKFFADIKGKITKSVEDKLTEIRSRHQEEESPKKGKLSRHKENSSFSDSEDFSESSISKTCGICSTTEGPEMSSEEEEKLADLERRPKKMGTKKMKLIRGSNRKMKEGYINVKTLRNIYEIATDLEVMPLDNSIDEIESGIDALEDNHFHQSANKQGTGEIHSSVDGKETDENRREAEDNIWVKNGQMDSEHFESNCNVNQQANNNINRDSILLKLSQEISNIEIDDDDGSICIKQITGLDIRSLTKNDSDNIRQARNYFAPKGFVDLRSYLNNNENSMANANGYNFVMVALVPLFVFCFWCLLLQSLSSFIGGMVMAFLLMFYFRRLFGNNKEHVSGSHQSSSAACSKMGNKLSVLEIPAAKEHKPITKIEGWMNEFPDKYDPHTYHVAQTQSVYVKLQGNLLRLSHTRAKIPKRVLWNEPKFKPAFTHHRIYNLSGARVFLLPKGLNKKRRWSKKYPVCVALKDECQMNLLFCNDNRENKGSKPSDESEDVKRQADGEQNKDEKGKEKCKTAKGKKQLEQKPQIYSHLFEKNEDYDFDSNSDEESPTKVPEKGTGPKDEKDNKEAETEEDDGVQVKQASIDHDKEHMANDESECDNNDNNLDEWTFLTPKNGSLSETCLYLFGRTAREKEDWFRRLRLAASMNNMESHDGQNMVSPSNSEAEAHETDIQMDYLKYMSRFQLKRHSREHLHGISDKHDNHKEETGKQQDKEGNVGVEPLSRDVFWFNVLMGRIIFDCLTNKQVFDWVKSFIQKKLSSIRLPYFIEELTLKDLHLGNEPPIFEQGNEPYTDERGLWIDLNVSYDGCFIIYIYTKLNLMKLKQPPQMTREFYEKECSAIYNSDVEDSAETSSDEDAARYLSQQQDQNPSSESPIGTGGPTNTSKKLIKMVDRIAESKFFQKASENRFVKKAMEGVSNTDLGIKIEIRHLCGTLAVNIPSPPSDRVWYGFRPVPELSLSAHPIVGEKNITFIHVKNWIEKKLILEFQKVLVIPNMDDLYLPILSPLVSGEQV